jgi:pantoate--beta-alanine ligase
MILFKKATDLHNYLDSQSKKGKNPGFVPTMGALHEGHISLIQASKKEKDITVCSIFVNPTQFNDAKDFEKYPVTLEKDIYKLETAGCDILFLPYIQEIYPEGIAVKSNYDLGYLETILEGKYRPGHFQGVCTVVHRLLEIVKPDRLYLGQKDYQQCIVISRLLQLINMKGIRIIICPTVRESDGLAMSSRNMRLGIKERANAVGIFRSLDFIKKNLYKGDMAELKKKAHGLLRQNDFKIDYAEIADAKTLQPVDIWDGHQKLLALIAAYMNEVRLIDNMLLN